MLELLLRCCNLRKGQHSCQRVPTNWRPCASCGRRRRRARTGARARRRVHFTLANHGIYMNGAARLDRRVETARETTRLKRAQDWEHAAVSCACVVDMLRQRFLLRTAVAVDDEWGAKRRRDGSAGRGGAGGRQCGPRVSAAFLPRVTADGGLAILARVKDEDEARGRGALAEREARHGRRLPATRKRHSASAKIISTGERGCRRRPLARASSHPDLNVPDLARGGGGSVLARILRRRQGIILVACRHAIVAVAAAPFSCHSAQR